MAHTHVFRAVDEVKNAIAAGVTTLFDMHNPPSNATFMKELSRNSNELPEIFSAFHAATVDGGWPRLSSATRTATQWYLYDTQTIKARTR